ncbi:MAG: carbohydrate ABC transporter permease [Anaerolineales bacterium]|nr:carbohydrate ABC transporter permease [Anaerolineales bacterium]
MPPTPSNNRFAPKNFIPLALWEKFGTSAFNLFIFLLLIVYLFPITYMIATAFMRSAQLGDRYAPPYPARQMTYLYEDKERKMYQVPFEEGVRELALVNAGTRSSEFIDPQNPDAGLITWEGSWRTLPGAYRFEITWDNFVQLLAAIPFERLIQNTLVIALISEVGVLISSIVVAYGFARFPLPGGDFLFYLMIATLLIPEKVTLIPTYFFFTRILDWEGTWFPILLPFFFGNAVYIFLLRQNFKSIPKEMEEAAMLDGAGPLRILFSVVIPQSWPVITTTALLHFFYIWNETRQAALYLSTRRDLIPVSFGVQNFQSLFPNQNMLQASALIVMLVPVVIILLAQRYFMQKLVVTGIEK